MSQSDLQVNISCELGTLAPPTICAECKWSTKYYPTMDSAPQRHCLLHRVGYVSNSPTEYRDCACINTKGQCPDFQKLPPASPVVISSGTQTWWDKFKDWFNF
jgi:hypothetical protein